MKMPPIQDENKEKKKGLLKPSKLNENVLPSKYRSKSINSKNGSSLRNPPFNSSWSFKNSRGKKPDSFLEALQASDIWGSDSSIVDRSSISGSDSSIRSERRVKFKDEGEIVEDNGQRKSIGSGDKLVEVAYYDTLMQSKEPWEDPNYYPGFKDVFAADQIWVSDISCLPCGLDSNYTIENKKGMRLFYVNKHQDRCWSLTKFLFPFSFCSRMKNGFRITIFTENQTPLVQFIKKGHCCTNQMDIVETIYIRDENYLGRIERTRHGYLIRDKEHRDIYRVIQSLPKDLMNKGQGRSWFLSKRKELKVYRTDTKEIVGRVVYFQKGILLGIFSCCFPQPSFGVLCNPDMGTNAKILILGALFFHLHNKDKYLDLRLGSDAIHNDKAQEERVSLLSLEILCNTSSTLQIDITP